MELVQGPYAHLAVFILILAIAVILFFVWRNNKNLPQQIINSLTSKKAVGEKILDGSGTAAGSKVDISTAPAPAEQVQTDIKEAEDEGAKLKEAIGSLVNAHTERKKARVHEKSASKNIGGPRLA
jgi:preprotein translocase subunit YajC